MKKVLLVVLVIVVVAFIVSTLQTSSESVTVGESYRGNNRIALVEFVGRGDSALARYPGVFQVSDNVVRQDVVVYRSGSDLYIQPLLMFKNEFDHVQSTPPGKRQP